MLKLKILIGLLILSGAVYSQSLITNTINRNTTTLNGTWNYIVDPYENGYYNYRYEAFDQLGGTQNSGYYSNYHPKDKLELVEYNFDLSPTMSVPGDWNSQKENLFYYEGTVWLRRMFDYSKTGPSNRVFVYFGAVNYKAEVYLNGVKLGIHEGGFTPFNFEITSIIKEKGNFLVVKVDNKRFKEAVPTLNTDWWNYGGITRDVLIIEEPTVFIQDYNIQLKKDNPEKINGFVRLNNSTHSEEVIISVPELNIEQKIITNAEGYATFEIQSKKISYWSTTSPKLYEITISTAYQKLKDDVGFRTISTSGPDILLNGKPVFLRGISIHEEKPMSGGRANSEADALILLTWAKELGCNFVRLAHYPHNEYMIRLADKMGILVWEEIPVYWTLEFTNPATYQNAKNQLTEAITRDKNRASIIIWSMANETPVSEPRNTFLINLVNYTKTLDSTRLISAALEKHAENGIQVVNDKMGEYLDIVAFNQYTGWYGGSLEDAPFTKWSILYNKPVIISEFGGDALQGLNGTIQERWTEEYQEYLYEQNLKMIEKIPNIMGLSPWILTDFRSPRRVLPGIQDGWNRKGLISSRGIRKKAFYTLQSFYKKIEEQSK